MPAYGSGYETGSKSSNYCQITKFTLLSTKFSIISTHAKLNQILLQAYFPETIGKIASPFVVRFLSSD